MGGSVSYQPNHVHIYLYTHTAKQISRFTHIRIHTHHAPKTNTQILHCRDLVPVLARLRGTLKARLRQYRDGLGVNAAGLRLLKREVAEDRNAFVVDVGEGEGAGAGAGAVAQKKQRV